ncbi:Threonylcarbamoyl-AMP synthase Short=TC-AMP synthase; AltName: Full=L-threonylcarbamoyladenylate synthase; AltName: Full=t(6)A37 threonylcarbamoyladenosine biosynthesis protein sua5; AltName: Full=tRNA threonylcarbamoyladenosine biosynthesis protein sua5 [Serendipita indica DSM 11827]|nr:Threonylcarbamoyl-AMP synthase Short=TC-AMP synthase; AltName: Full=L-threonylcarbamoyladenylate synthase; AltName: Full=t(6)A37 threonylcarbamoyladenosine biosynthesis protein sua5; AltName: Full=tRNA threonylcarbamoyladenosine biosynthesis protein sua5 [Serendipita indica DSM 11827]
MSFTSMNEYLRRIFRSRMLQLLRSTLQRLFSPRFLSTSSTSSLMETKTKKLQETSVLLCDPQSITFQPNSTTPEITSPSTLDALQHASGILHSSSLVVFPTETVYGLAANALSATATSQIFQTKGRPADNPLIVHVSSVEMLRDVIDPSFVIPQTYAILMREFWPGPLTLLFPVKPFSNEHEGNKSGVPREVTAGHSTVAVRMPSHPVARALIALSGLPLAAPSANTSGRPSPTRAEHVVDDLAGKVPLILDGGPCDVGVESTVVDGLSGNEGEIRILRPGGVTAEQMQRVLGTGVRVLVHRRDYRDEQLEHQPTTPGMKYRHYSPTCPVYLLLATPSEEAISLDQLLQNVAQDVKAVKTLELGLLSLTGSKLTDALVKQNATLANNVQIEWRVRALGRVGDDAGVEQDLSEPARRLFDGLISLDKLGVAAILVEGVEEEREGLAVMNRVRKAAGQTVSVRI